MPGGWAGPGGCPRGPGGQQTNRSRHSAKFDQIYVNGKYVCVVEYNIYIHL